MAKITKSELKQMIREMLKEELLHEMKVPVRRVTRRATAAADITAIIDCSASFLKSDVEELTQIAAGMGATEFYYFSDNVYTDIDSALSGYMTNYTQVCAFVDKNPNKQYIVFTDADIECMRDGDRLQNYPNVRIERAEDYGIVNL